MQGTKNHVMLSEQPCIYCASTTTPTKREHVIPRALGTFEQNWTLDCVCDECNHFFSRELELALGRDSAEAFFRVDFGVKPPEAAEKFLNTRMRATVKTSGLFHGGRVVVQPTDDKDGISPVLIPQVAFRQAEDDWRYVPEADLNEESIPRPGAGPFQVKIIGRGDDLPRLKQRLAMLGIEFTERESFLGQPIAEDNPVLVEHEFFVDKTLRRAASKIAFNYATKVLGPNRMRHPDFDLVRRFVRFGEEPLALVVVRPVSILTGAEAPATKAHACGLGWLADDQNLIAIVSLFNQVTYWIRMCHSESDDWARVSSQHLFDPIERIIVDLQVLS